MDLDGVEHGGPRGSIPFWEAVDRSAGPDGCWPPIFRAECLFPGKMPRTAWAMMNGPIPKGMHLLHDPVRCNRSWCCNPCHARLGTHLENMRDKAIADMGSVTHCRCGTRYEPGGRVCLYCEEIEAAAAAVMRSRVWSLP